jgi:hypothetical protein
VKKAILVDIDDCIIDVTNRKAKIFSFILNRKITKKDVIGKRTAEVLSQYVNQKEIQKYRKRFWEIAFCLDKIGLNFLKYDKPVPYSRKVLRKISNNYEILYISSRIESMLNISIEQLKKFNFPYYNNVYHASDSYFLMDIKSARSDVLSKIPKNYEYFCVIDDMPDNFELYKLIKIPHIVGFLRYVVLDEKQYWLNGATYVFKNWKNFPFEIFNDTKK